MAETITTGTVAQSGSRLYLVGTASELDTSALVEAAYDQKVAKADSIDIRVAENQSEIDAYSTLQTLGNSLTTALEALKTSYGYSTADSSVYNDMTAYLSSSGSTDPSNLLSASVDETAAQGQYSLEIVQLATAMKATGTAVADKSAALGYDGSFTLALGDADEVQIDVTISMSLQDIANAINNAGAAIKATIIKSGDNSYTLTVTGQETGQDIQYGYVAGNDLFQSLGLTDSGQDFVSIVQGAQSAIVILDGVEVTSSTNTLADIVEGVSVTLYGQEDGAIINLEIDYDYSATKDAIVAFVDAYNALRDFIIQNQQVGSDGTVSEDAALFGDSLLKGLGNQASSILTATFGNDDSLNNLGDLGITLDSDNKLIVSNEEKLNSALLDNYDSVRNLFQTAMTTDSGNIAILRNESSISALDITLDIVTDGSGNITGVTANGDSAAFTVDGTRLIGASGTAYEGLTFVYTGTADATLNLSLNQGLADRLYNLVDSYTSSTDGLVQTKITSIESVNAQLDTEADRIRERAEAFREKEIDRYAAMETKVQSAKSLLKTIQALLGTSDDD